MENKAEFIAYKKLLIFGAEETGKSSFVSKLETNSFPDEYTSSEKGTFFLTPFPRHFHHSSDFQDQRQANQC